MQYIKYILVTLLIALAYIGGFLTHKKVAKSVTVTTTECHTDTVIKWQTVVEQHPVYRTERVTDTMRVYIDSARLTRRQDSTFLTLPKTTKTYQGDYYTLAVSGYQPNLDYLKINIPTKIVRELPKLNHLTVTMTAAWDAALYVPITARYEYGNDLRIGGSIGYDIIRRSPVLAVHGSYSFGW